MKRMISKDFLISLSHNCWCFFLHATPRAILSRQHWGKELSTWSVAAMDSWKIANCLLGLVQEHYDYNLWPNPVSDHCMFPATPVDSKMTLVSGEHCLDSCEGWVQRSGCGLFQLCVTTAKLACSYTCLEELYKLYSSGIDIMLPMRPGWPTHLPRRKDGGCIVLSLALPWRHFVSFSVCLLPMCAEQWAVSNLFGNINL